MKAYLKLPLYIPASLLLLISILSACGTARKLGKDDAEVKSIKLVGIDKQYQETVLMYVQKDLRPSTVFKKIFYSVFKNGNPPNLLDSPLVEISRNQIQKYLETKGFFEAKVKADIEVKNKKAAITFTAERGTMYRFRNFTVDIADSVVRELYNQNCERISKIHSGMRYDRDSVSLQIENIYNLMRQNGYYDYLRQYSHVYVNTNTDSAMADISLVISNPVGEDHHQVYTIDTTFTTILNSSSLMPGKPDTSLIDSQYIFRDYSQRFNTKVLAKYIFLKRGELYNIEKGNITSNRMYDLNVFKSVKLEYTKTNDSTFKLNPYIETIPLKRMSNRIEGEYTFNSGRSGFNIGNTYTNRNVFGGAEQLDVKFRYGILFDSRTNSKLFSNVFNRDVQVGVNLSIPQLLVPFGITFNHKNGVPHTSFASSVQIFDQKNTFKNRTLINSITYDWVETRYKQHSLTPLNFEYRSGILDETFKQSLEDQGYGLYVITNARRYISIGSQYSYTYNAVRLTSNRNFLYLKASADLAGNSIGLVRSVLGLNKGDQSSKIFGQEYLQYAKSEVDFRVYRTLGPDKQFIARLNTGVGIPIANSQSLPFEKNFYVGGSNGIRAWQSRTLGPGQYNRSSIKDENTRRNLRNLDQLGEIKLEGNLEYRFILLNNIYGFKLRGAAFTDFGNVWRLRERDNVINPGGNFDTGKFLGQIAIGTGGGLRLDLEYFVIRLDVGVKVYDPQFIGSGKYDPWVIKHIFKPTDFKNSFKLSNSPDEFRFAQYNFGIGMPF